MGGGSSCPKKRPVDDAADSPEPPATHQQSDSSLQQRLSSPLQVETKAEPAPKVYDLEACATASHVGVVCGPADKSVAGIAEDSFQKVVQFQDSGISELLQKSIDQISTDLFNLPFSVSVAMPSILDSPLIGISDGFSNLTGYGREEILGHNCRFLLKGVPAEDVKNETRLEARRYCRMAHLRGLSRMSHTFLMQRNARKNGELFWNLFMMAMVPGKHKQTFIVGLQLDLGPTLWGADGHMTPESAIETHRKNLTFVQGMMFGTSPAPSLGTAGSTFDYLGLAEDIDTWLSQAEASSEQFQSWGTLPWAAWPSSRHALLSGGVTLLRTEADVVPTGAVAMSIFPAAKKGSAKTFKIRIDSMCPQWEHRVQMGARLPSMGFTEVAPSKMDSVGGLPGKVEACHQSVVLRGDGVFCRYTTDEEGEGVMQSMEAAAAQFPYEMQEQDTLECVWGKGFMRLEANSQVVF
eukprot:TRINITY_DN89562_c0_g1_i1.p1 TRINITY_DN89562_c0_g1~~TRINITY_DN89562_c0_g1_i1.p1  ORF type:complete len:465 (+),score=87.54 TRINITY_DN89562_c0_g1_i1:71-1465(+)